MGEENHHRQHRTKRRNASRRKAEAKELVLLTRSVAGDNSTISEEVRPGENGGVKTRYKIAHRPPTTTVVNDAPISSQRILEQAGTATTNASCASSPEKEAADNQEGVRRIPGVWTRRGMWAPANKMSDETADRLQERRVGDRQRQRLEDEEVEKEGNAKRKELLEFLQTSEGEALVDRVAKLLTHARREEKREARVATRTQQAELRAIQRRHEQTQRMTRTRTTWFSGSWALTKSSEDGEKTKTNKSLHAATAEITATEPWRAKGEVNASLAGEGRGGGEGGAGMEATAAASPDWDTDMSENAEDGVVVGKSQDTVVTPATNATGGSLSSSLPSAVAAAAMEMEDEEDVHRLVGLLKEAKNAWDLKNRPPFLEAFGRFDPEGTGQILASDIVDLLAQLRLPEALRPEVVEATTAALIKESDLERQKAKRAAARAARQSGLDQTPSPLRPFTTRGGEKTVSMLIFWRWHRAQHSQWLSSQKKTPRREARKLASMQRKRERTGEISRDWARRLLLAVCEREARLQAAERFRGRDPPRFVCPECHEFGCSTPDGLDEHLSNISWHETHDALQSTFEENADLVTIAKQFGDRDQFPEYFQVARDMPEEMELPVHQEPNEISRPLGTIKFDMLVLALAEEGEWLKINFESHRGVYVKHTTADVHNPRRRRRVITRMRLPPARAAAKAAASTAHLSATATSTFARPITFAASGLHALGHATMSTINAIPFAALHGRGGGGGHRHEPESLAPGTAIFKSRVVRFVLPRVYCHAPGLPVGAMLKVRTEPGGEDVEDRESGRSSVLGRVGEGQCVIALASSGDWLQVRYKSYEAAWMLMTYKGRRLLAALSDVYPGVVIVVAAGGPGRDEGVRDSPFPMPVEVLEKEQARRTTAENERQVAVVTAAPKTENGNSRQKPLMV